MRKSYLCKNDEEENDARCCESDRERVPDTAIKLLIKFNKIK